MGVENLRLQVKYLQFRVFIGYYVVSSLRYIRR